MLPSVLIADVLTKLNRKETDNYFHKINDCYDESALGTTTIKYRKPDYDNDDSLVEKRKI